jgi:Raf kinase inhibitor-like YbhB/YbcL family protein
METEVVVSAVLQISSPSFTQDGYIPKAFTCEGKGVSPELRIEDIPGEAKTLALIVEDPDAPGKIFDHWVVWNIPPSNRITENAVPGLEGKNGKGEIGYTGPCPPEGTHRYFFKVYAVDTLLDLREGATKMELIEALRDHTLAYGELIGMYQKQ